MNDLHADVIIIGAGIAGINAGDLILLLKLFICFIPAFNFLNY